MDLLEENLFYKTKRFELFLGNSLELLPKIPDKSIDMIFADPPYNLSNNGFTCHAGRRVSVNKGTWDESQGVENDFSFHYNWIGLCKRILKDNGTIWISGTYHSIYACGFALKKLGYHILNDIAWFKPNASPNLSGRYFSASHETLIWARKSKTAKHKFNYQKMKSGSFPEDKLKNPGKQMRSVWSIPTPKPSEKKFGKHPTQKPLNLLKRVVQASSNEGDLILDPFTGSSTTGLASYLLGRRFIGIDNGEEYLELSQKRIDDLIKKIEEKNKQNSLFPEGQDDYHEIL